MGAARFSSNVLQTFYGPITREQNRNLRQPLESELVPLYDVFNISQSNFQEWLRVWIMDVSKTNPNNKDILMFARENKEKFTDLVEQEILKLNSVKQRRIQGRGDGGCNPPFGQNFLVIFFYSS